MWKGGGREKESEADSTLSMEADMRLDYTTLRSWPELKPKVRCLTNWATHVPLVFNYFYINPAFANNIAKGQKKKKRARSCIINQLVLSIIEMVKSKMVSDFWSRIYNKMLRKNQLLSSHRTTCTVQLFLLTVIYWKCIPFNVLSLVSFSIFPIPKTTLCKQWVLI